MTITKRMRIAGVLLLAAGLMNTARAQRDNKEGLVEELKKIKDTTLLRQRIQALQASDKEGDLTAVILYYYSQRKEKEAETLIAVAREKFPAGLYAFANASNTIVKTKGAAKQEQLLQEMLTRFPEIRDKTIAIYAVAHSYAEEGDTAKSAKYTQMIKVNHDLPSRLYNLSKGAVAGGQNRYALHLMERSIALFDSLKNVPDNGGDPLGMAKNPKRYGSMFYTQYALLLDKNDETAKAATYAKMAYENNTADNEAAGNYAGLLVKDKQYAAALPVLEALVSKGMSNAGIRAHLKEAYIALRGAAGYDAYLTDITRTLKQAAIDSVQKQVITEPAPMFTLSDVDGKNWSLAELQGKVVVLDFWATWCTPCKKSFPAMQMAVNKYSKDTNVVFLFIHTWERNENAAADARKYVTDNKYRFHVLMDLKNGGQNKVVSSFKARGIPAKFVIDGKGNIRFKLTGFSGGDDAAVEELSAMIDLAKK